MEQKQSRFHLWLKNAFHIEGVLSLFVGIFLCALWCNAGNIQGWLRSHQEASYALIFLLVAIAVIGTLYHMRGKRKRPMLWGGGWMPLGFLVSGLVFGLLGYIEAPYLIGLFICCGVLFLLDYVLWTGRATRDS